MELHFHGGPNLARVDQFWLPKLVRGDRFFRYRPDHRSDMYSPKLKDSELCLEGLTVDDMTYDRAKKLIIANYPGVNLVFTKEHACFLPESMYEDMVDGEFGEVVHIFLIRDPERALYLNYKSLLKFHMQEPYLYPADGWLVTYTSSTAS